MTTERQLLHEFSLAALFTRTVLDAMRNGMSLTPREEALYAKLSMLLEMSKRFELTAEELKAWERIKKEERWKS